MTIDVPSGREATIPTPAAGDPSLKDLSLNQRTIARWSVPEVIDACVRHGIPAVGLWREPVAETGLKESARLVEQAGLRVSSLCRAGFLTALSKEEAQASIDSTVKAIEEAAELGAAVLPIIPGGIPPGDTDLPAARNRFLETFDDLVPIAASNGVRLGIEPLHPMFCADRSVVVTLADALDLVADYPEETVGVVVDAYNIWWDPKVDDALARSRGRILSYQVSDWILPLAEDPLLSRGMMGDGFIALPALGAKVAATGYEGDVEVEIFNADIWAADPDQALATVMRRHSLYTSLKV